jgi:tetratricopeptide (TPR) repeat protein
MRRLGLRTISLFALLLAWPASMPAQDPGLEYLDLVLRYRAGEHAEAVLKAARMPSDDLRKRIDETLWSGTCRTAAGLGACRGVAAAPGPQRLRLVETWQATYPAALLLHLEIVDALYRAQRTDAVNLHRDIVRDLLQRMGEIVGLRWTDVGGGLAALESARRRGQLLFLWMLQGQVEHGMVESDVARMLREFPDDSDLLLASGWVNEFRSRPLVLRDQYRARPDSLRLPGGREAWLSGQRDHWRSRAERQYQLVIARDGRHAEAHLRLGRVVSLGERPADARPILARVRELTKEPRLHYLARLFEADTEERTGNRREARDSYVAALGIWPSAQSARLGLSRLRLLDREYAEARELLPRQASGGAGAGEAADPWFLYDYGQWWRVKSAFASMKAELRP